MTEKCGTPCYLAPEILTNKCYDCMKADIWSTGILLYTFLNGNIPFNYLDQESFQKSIIESEITYSEEISQEGRDFLSKILNIDLDKRLNAKELRSHNWFNNYDP